MCFKSKVKTPKPQQPGAPEPVLLEDPKGVEFGAESDKEVGTDKLTQIEREGESSDVPSAFSTASSPKRKKSTMSATAVRKSVTRT
ncbi:putative phage head protein [Pseudomonas sp.]|jgi:hypothetical protein|uniref:putative phage head protein n=1 Tax=Pseudomonas sp. TaxID=306 RepID=UPI0037CBF6A4